MRWLVLASLMLLIGLSVATPAWASGSKRCAASQLRPVAAFYTGAMDNELVDFRLTNTGTRCELRGYPSVLPMTSGGHPMSVREIRTRQPFPSGKNLPVRTVVLLHGGSAYFTLGYREFDPAGHGHACRPFAVSARVRAPGARRGKIVRFSKDVEVGFCADVMRVGPVVARRPWG